MTNLKMLNMEEREALSDLLRHDGWQPLMRVIDMLASDQERLLIKATSLEGSNKLFELKLRSEGARKLAADIEKLKATILKEERANSNRP